MAKRIVIIEDDPKSLYALQAILEDDGHDVRGYSSAEEAQIDGAEVAIIDVRLPQQQGTEFAKQLQARVPGVRIVLMTAYNGIGVIRENMPGATVLAKPLNLDALRQSI